MSAKTSKGAAKSKEPEQDLGPPCLFFEDPSDPEAPVVPQSILSSVAAFRVLPGKEDGTEMLSHAGEYNPAGSLDDIRRQVGGGIFDLRGRAIGSRSFVCGRRVSIEGAPRVVAPAAPSGPPAPHVPPIMETANGLAGIEGLPPWVQLFFAQHQLSTAQMREDYREQLKNIVTMFEALAKRPEPAPQHMPTSLLTAQLEAMRSELKEARDQVRQEGEQRFKLALSKTQLEANATTPATIITAKLAEKFDELAGLVAMALSKGQIQMQMAPQQLGPVTITHANGTATTGPAAGGSTTGQ